MSSDNATTSTGPAPLSAAQVAALGQPEAPASSTGDEQATDAPSSTATDAAADGAAAGGASDTKDNTDDTKSSGSSVSHRLSHMVYFTLKEPTDDKLADMLNDMRRDLGKSKHEGVVHFYVGVQTSDLKRPVNQDFHAALNLVFETRAHHDAYQTSELHQAFIAKWKPEWESVRVFDANVLVERSSGQKRERGGRNRRGGVRQREKRMRAEARMSGGNSVALGRARAPSSSAPPAPPVDVGEAAAKAREAFELLVKGQQP